MYGLADNDGHILATSRLKSEFPCIHHASATLSPRYAMSLVKVDLVLQKRDE